MRTSTSGRLPGGRLTAGQFCEGFRKTGKAPLARSLQSWDTDAEIERVPCRTFCESERSERAWQNGFALYPKKAISGQRNEGAEEDLMVYLRLSVGFIFLFALRLN
jgi:hypothetical protein